MTVALPVGYVRITSKDPPVTITCRLSEDRPNVEAGYGGWVEVARPRRRPLSIWAGSPALRMTLPILFDKWGDGRESVERAISRLESLSLPNASDGQPPRIKVAARGGGVPHQGKTWVVDSLAWGDALANRAGDRTRQQVTLSLLEFIADVRVSEDSSAGRLRRQSARAKTKAGAGSKMVVAKQKPGVKKSTRSTTDDTFGTGESLTSIAAREYGDAARWVEIAQLNGLRDPQAVRPGQVLRLP